MRTAPIRYRWVIEPVEARAARAAGDNGGAGRWAPPADVLETETSWLVEMDLPGVDPETVEVTFEQGELVVAGERHAPGDGAVRRERAAGPFRRVIRLTDEVAADRIRATSWHGVLRIEVPKAEAARPRRIPVHAESAS